MERPDRRQHKRRAADDRVGHDPRRHVLVVDPDADQRELLAFILNLSGYLVRTAADGADGLRLAREHLPDVIITELVMPALDGLALLRALRDQPLTKDIPAFVVTASADEGSLTRARLCHAAAVLPKPAAPDKLTEVVENLLRWTHPTTLVVRSLKRTLLILQRVARHYAVHPDVRGRLASLIDRVQEAVLMLDEKGQLLAMNRLAEALIHLTPDDQAGGPALLVATADWKDVRRVEHWAGEMTLGRVGPGDIRVRAVCLATGVAGIYFAAVAGL